MSHDHELEEGPELRLNFEKRGGLLPVTVQDAETKRILMMAWVNEAALQETIHSGLATFWSTSRHELWKKGLTSGDTLSIVQILVDCDQDALVYVVRRNGGGVCHTIDPQTGKHRLSCFYRELDFDSHNLKFIHLI